MIKWPAIIQFVGDAELTHINSEVDWVRDPQLHAVRYLPGERLIDSNSIEYTLGEHVNGSVVPRPTGRESRWMK